MEDVNEDGEQALEPGQKVATEVCETDFERFCDSMDIDAEQSGMDDADRKSLVSNKRTMMRYMKRGALVINGTGEAVLTPQYGEDKHRSPITFFMPEGTAWMAMDGKKETHDVRKLLDSMADITHESQVRFKRMQGPDFKVCVAIVTLFLG